MKARSVYDALASNEDAQRRYRESPEFRHFIDEFENCLRVAEETLSRQEYELFVTQELPKILREVG